VFAPGGPTEGDSRALAPYARNDGQARVQLPEQPPRMQTPSGQAPDVSLVDSLRDHVNTLKAQLATAEARVATSDAELARAISAFADLARRLDQLAADRARPWWRRLARS
jgi:hypothetical protein